MQIFTGPLGFLGLINQTNNLVLFVPTLPFFDGFNGFVWVFPMRDALI
jgi:hypothetical protein